MMMMKSFSGTKGRALHRGCKNELQQHGNESSSPSSSSSSSHHHTELPKNHRRRKGMKGLVKGLMKGSSRATRIASARESSSCVPLKEEVLKLVSLSQVNYFGVDAATLMDAVRCVHKVENMSEEELKAAFFTSLN